MSKYTVDDKFDYQDQKRPMYKNGQFNPESEFGVGYKTGVNFYQMYPGANKALRKTIDESIAEWKKLAKQGDKYGKGVLCGMRDAANERKAKAKKKK